MIFLLGFNEQGQMNIKNTLLEGSVELLDQSTLRVSSQGSGEGILVS